MAQVNALSSDLRTTKAKLQYAEASASRKASAAAQLPEMALAPGQAAALMETQQSTAAEPGRQQQEEQAGFAGGNAEAMQTIQLTQGQMDDGMGLGALPTSVRASLDEGRPRVAGRRSSKQLQQQRVRPGERAKKEPQVVKVVEKAPPPPSLVDLENAALEQKEEQMMAVVRQGQEQKRRLDLTILKQKEMIGNLTNELKVVIEEVKASKGAQLVAHRRDMEAIINQNMGLLQRHQEMLRNIPHVLKECGKQNLQRQKAVESVEEQTRVQIRKLDQSHVTELQKLREEYSTFKAQHELARNAAEHKCTVLEKQLAATARLGEACTSHLHQACAGLLSSILTMENKAPPGLQRTGLNLNMLPRVDVIQQTGGAAELGHLIKTANLYVTGRQRPSSAQPTRKPPALKLPDATHVVYNGKSTRDMSREELVLAVKELVPLATAVTKRAGTADSDKPEVEKLRAELQVARVANKSAQAALMAKERIIAGMDQERAPVALSSGSQTERGSTRRPSSARLVRPTAGNQSARRSNSTRAKNACVRSDPAGIIHLIEQTNRGGVR